MTPLQELEVRAADIRRRLGEIADIPETDWTDEITTELSGLRSEHGRNELRQSAMKLAGDGAPVPVETATVPDDKLVELRNSLQFGTYIAAAMGGRPVMAGPELEYNQERGIRDGYFPMEMLADGLPETRAARDGDSQTNQGSWLDRVFYNSASDRVGISFRTVAPGVASYPITVAGGGGVQRAREEAVTESTYTVAITEMKPTRHAVHGIYTVEDDMRLPGMADAIERDMRAGLVDSIDLACFKGDAGATGTDADIVGLQTAGITEGTLTQAQKVMADDTLAYFLTHVDGRYAASMSDLSIVTAVGTNTLWYSTIHNSTVDNQTLAQFLMASGVNWTARGDIDGNTDNGTFGAYIGLNRGIDGCGIAAVWDSGQLISDNFGDHATKGEVALDGQLPVESGISPNREFQAFEVCTT